MTTESQKSATSTTNYPPAPYGSSLSASVSHEQQVPGSFPRETEPEPSAQPTVKETDEDQKSCQLPTKEHPSGSKVGVGSLPGNISESSVAKLPEERAQEAKAAQAERAEVSPKQAQPSSLRQSVLAASIPSKKFEEKDADEKSCQLPTKEHPSGSKVGVGSLPGNISESSVAKLPEERRMERASQEKEKEKAQEQEQKRETEATPAVTSSTEAGQQETKGAGSESEHPAEPTAQATESTGTESERPAETEPEGKTEKAKEKAPEAKEPAPEATPEAKPEAKPEEAKPESKAEVKPEAQPETKPEAQAEAPAQKEPAAETKPPEQPPAKEAEAGAGAAAAGAAAEQPPPPKPHKVGFMDKVKGEAKIIQGRLSKNEKKIEEGKHMMGRV